MKHDMSEIGSPENDDYDAVLPSAADRLLRPRRTFVVFAVLIGVLVCSLLAFGASLLWQAEVTPPNVETAKAPPEPERPPVKPVEPPKTIDSLMLDATRSYLSSSNPNAQAATDTARLQLCLFIEDGYRERLDCFDKIFAPDPKPNPPSVTKIADCKFIKEQDQRLACFNRFMAASSLPQPAQKVTSKARPSK